MVDIGWERGRRVADTMRYTLPVQGDDDDPVQWTRLPVVDKLWRLGQPDKGGFIQEATGWKPSPLQSHADIRVLALAAHLRAPG